MPILGAEFQPKGDPYRYKYLDSENIEFTGPDGNKGLLQASELSKTDQGSRWLASNGPEKPNPTKEQTASLGGALMQAPAVLGFLSNAISEAIASYGRPAIELAKYALGSDAPVTKESFSKEAQKFLAQQAGQVFYRDLQAQGGALHAGAAPGGATAGESAIDEVSYILGRFRAIKTPEGGLRIQDAYDFREGALDTGQGILRNLKNAETRKERGQNLAAMLSTAQAYAPLARATVQSLLGKEVNDQRAVDVEFSKEEIKKLTAPVKDKLEARADTQKAFDMFFKMIRLVP